MKIIYTLIAMPFILIFRIYIYLIKSKWNTKINNNLYISWWYIFQRDYDFIINKKIDIVINLASELYISKKIWILSKYYKFNIIDWWIPTINQLNKINDIYLMAKNNNSKIQINCALGSWRSAFVILFLLMNNKEFNDIDIAIKFLKSIRPQIWLNFYQLKALKDIINYKK